MILSLIVAMSTNRVIGLNNSIPWRLPADLKRFKSLTMGHCLVMGRKTFESIGRPLPGRTIVVLTHQKDFAPPGVFVAHTLDEALRIAKKTVTSDKWPVMSEESPLVTRHSSLVTDFEVFIAGGAQIYQQTLALADRLYLTVIDGEFAGDAYFPSFDETDWQLISEERHEGTEIFAHSYSFLVYERKT